MNVLRFSDPGYEQKLEQLASHSSLFDSVIDERTRAIVEAMRDDEAKHRMTAVRLGAAELPAPVRAAMRFASKVMTTVAYRV